MTSKSFTILDVGCGGGGTVRKLARIAVEGKVYGFDWSEDSVAELEEIFSIAGYSEVQLFEKYELDFICGVGSKPF